ncbi:carboxypeptidase regulatory-like domain-containing protein [Nonomuraea sp. NPDC049419]|uniref:MSCRAMM family protein n=1 Tax=Nonomuraea sp. NPDC049419 TaxID=3155772 RepID=UPI003417D311
MPVPDASASGTPALGLSAPQAAGPQATAPHSSLPHAVPSAFAGAREPAYAQAPGGVEIRGFVSGDDGAPIGQATLTLIDMGGTQLGRAMTLADGAYSIWAPGAGTYVLIASVAHRDPQVATLAVGSRPLDFNVRLAGSSRLAGTVRDQEGKPVPGAVLALTDTRGEVIATSTTDADGAYAFSGVAPGAYTLAVSAGSHRPAAVPTEVTATGRTRCDVELRPGTRIRGTVRVRDGVPLTDARVTLLDAAGNVVGTTITGDDGAYAFADLTGGQYTVIATGYPPVADTVTVNGADEEGRDLWLAHEE